MNSKFLRQLTKGSTYVEKALKDNIFWWILKHVEDCPNNISKFKHRGINVIRNDKYIEELKVKRDTYVLNSTNAQMKGDCWKRRSNNQLQTLTRKIFSNQHEDSNGYFYGELEEGEQFKDLQIGDFVFQGKILTGFWIGEFLKRISTKAQTSLKALLFVQKFALNLIFTQNAN